MKKEKDYVPSKGLGILTRNKKIVSIVFIFLYLVIIIAVYLGLNRDLENTYFISQIIGGIFVVSGLIVSVLQYTASYVDNMILSEKERKIKAAEMAYNFQAEIIPLSSTLSKAFVRSGLDKELLPKIKNKKLEMFDHDEVISIINEKELESALQKLYAAYLLNHHKDKNVIATDDGKIKLQFNILEKLQAQEAFDTCIQDLANKLEYFSICFNSGIANEDTVYQSLHDVYFQCVHMLYVFIFNGNTTESNRLFSNVSTLYVKWHERYEELTEKENRELSDMKKKVKSKIIVEARE